MDKFNKITNGFVVQSYSRLSNGKYCCLEQEFIASDSVFEDKTGNSIRDPEHAYQAFNMNLVSTGEMVIVIESVLAGLDVGGDQSGEFEVEIVLLKTLLKSLQTSDSVNNCSVRESVLLKYCGDLISYTIELLTQINDQEDLSEIEPLRRAKAIVELYEK